MDNNVKENRLKLVAHERAARNAIHHARWKYHTGAAKLLRKKIAAMENPHA